MLSVALVLARGGVSRSVHPARWPRSGADGAVYTLTNSPAGNAVKVFHRAGDGSLTPGGEFATGGIGTGGGLGNQGALVLDDGRLFAVNPGQRFDLGLQGQGKRGLELVDTVASGGDLPISVTVDDGLLYVLNAGDPGNITRLRVLEAEGPAPTAGLDPPAQRKRRRARRRCHSTRG